MQNNRKGALSSLFFGHIRLPAKIPQCLPLLHLPSFFSPVPLHYQKEYAGSTLLDDLRRSDGQMCVKKKQYGDQCNILSHNFILQFHT